MEAGKLKKMFDYQRFDKNPELAALIDETEQRTSSDSRWLLTMDELEMVAGGTPRAIDTTTNDPVQPVQVPGQATGQPGQQTDPQALQFIPIQQPLEQPFTQLT